MALTEKNHLIAFPDYAKNALNERIKFIDESVLNNAYTQGNIKHTLEAIENFKATLDAAIDFDKNAIDFRFFNAKAAEIKLRIETLPKNPFE